LIRLYRKRLVICSEWGEGVYLNEGLMKVLTGGGDAISVRGLYSKTYLEFTPEFLIMLSTNHKPNISGMDYGTWRRLLIIPFEINFDDAEHIAQRDQNLETYLRTNEGAGILNWILEGYNQYKEKGIGATEGMAIPQKLLTLKAKYKEEMDSVGEFLHESTFRPEYNTTEYNETRITCADLHSAYRTWASHNGHLPKGSKSFSQSLHSKGIERSNVGTKRGFKGVRLLTINEIHATDETIKDGSTHIDAKGLTIN